MAPSNNRRVRLTVEGRDDLHAIIHFMRRRGVDWDDEPNAPHVHEAGGVEELLDSIPTTLMNHDVAGFVVDADENLDQRWEQLTSRFARKGVELPDEPPADGFIEEEGFLPDQRVGVWIMPDNNIEGTLEDFLAYLVPDDSRSIYAYAGDCVEDARDMGADCSQGDHDKAQLHTWLAWQERPGMPYGQAITAEVFDRDGDAAHRFVEWFEDLYQL